MAISLTFFLVVCVGCPVFGAVWALLILLSNAFRIKRRQKMAKQDNGTPTSEEFDGYVIYDVDGNEILRQGVRTTEYENDDYDRLERISENIVLDDGRIWTISQMQRPGRNAVYVSQCPICLRRRRSMFRRPRANYPALSTTSSMRRCFRCGTYVCSRHYVLSSDNHIRCRQCNRRYFWYHLFTRFFTFIFFEEV